jgi:hypothetical protein
LLKGTIIEANTSLAFMLSIDVKDGRYRARIYDAEYRFSYGNLTDKTLLDAYFQDANQYKADGTPSKKCAKFGAKWSDQFTGILDSLKKSMVSKSPRDKDDW